MSDLQENSINEMVIFSNIINNPRYFNRVWSHLKKDYFEEGSSYRRLFEIIKRYTNKFNGIPTLNAIKLEVSNSMDSERYHAQLMNVVDNLDNFYSTKDDVEYLVNFTQTYVRRVAFQNALVISYTAMTNEQLPPEKRDRKIISMEKAQELMAEATRITFDKDIGLNYKDSLQRSIEYNTNSAIKIPFLMDSLNHHTGNGIPRKTLQGILASTNVGKSMGLVELATQYLLQGYNVVIFTMEMEEDIYKRRIDSNILDIPLTHLEGKNFDKEEYTRRYNKLIEEEGLGELFIKEYETGGPNINTFEGYLNELRFETGVVPDIIIVDYIGIIRSIDHTDKEYQNLINASVDLRRLAQRFNAVVWTATQGNKNTVNNINVDLDDGSGSFGMFSNFDFVLALSENQDYIEASQQYLKIIKSRYGAKDVGIKISVSKLNQRWNDVDEYFSTPENPVTQSVRTVSENQMNILENAISKNKAKKKIKNEDLIIEREIPTTGNRNTMDVDLDDVFGNYIQDDIDAIEEKPTIIENESGIKLEVPQELGEIDDIW